MRVRELIAVLSKMDQEACVNVFAHAEYECELDDVCASELYMEVVQVEPIVFVDGEPFELPDEVHITVSLSDRFAVVDEDDEVCIAAMKKNAYPPTKDES